MDETYRVTIDYEAEEKIANIVKYLTENASPQTAENVRAGLFEAMKGLRIMPES